MLPKGKWVGGKNAYDMVPGFRELFELLGVELGQQPTAGEIQHLFELAGTDKLFEDNCALTLDDSFVPSKQVLDLLRGTGTLRRIPMRTVLGPCSPPAKSTVVMLQPGATAPWMERRITQMAEAHLRVGAMFALASDTRRCDSTTEQNHPAVVAFRDQHRRIPREWELQRIQLRPATYYGYSSVHVADNLEDNVRELFAKRPELAHAKIAVFTNANATYVPLLIRRIIRQLHPSFDTTEDQFWFCQDSFLLATTLKQAANPAKRQRPLTMIPALIRLVRELYLLNGGTPL